MCILMAIVCCLINAPFAFNYKSLYAGDFTYVDSSTGLTKVNHLYVILPTEMANSKEGFSVIVALFVIRDIFTLLVGIVLNITLLIQMRNFLIERAKKFSENKIKSRNLDCAPNSVLHTREKMMSQSTNKTG
jgi:hypothetical protein